MNFDQKICYVNSLYQTLNIPMIYRQKDAQYEFQPYIIDAADTERTSIYDRLRNVFTHFSEENAFYFINKHLLLFGIVINRQEDEVIFVGPIATPATSDQNIEDFLFETDLSPQTSEHIRNYLRSYRTFSVLQLQELIININLILNGSVLAPDDLISIYDRERNTKEKIATKTYANEDFEDEIHADIIEEYTNRMNYCIVNGDTDTLQDMLFKMESVSFPEGNINAINDARVSAIGALFVAHSIARQSNVNPRELERIKQYYLMKIQSAQQIAEINMQMVSALMEFTQYIKDNKTYSTNNPTINKAIRYIQTNITEKITASQIAESLHISQNYLFMKFKDETGSTLTQFINAEKVKKAEYYLTMTDKSLVDIANHLSFSSQSYFQTVFKNITGQTPNAYRESHKG